MESIQNDKLPLCTKFGMNPCISLQTIPFVANNCIMQHFVAYFRPLLHFAATWFFFWKRIPLESIQNDKLPLCTKFGMNPCISLQIIPFVANNCIMQHFAAYFRPLLHFAATWLFFWKRIPLESIQNDKLPLCTKFGSNP